MRGAIGRITRDTYGHREGHRQPFRKSDTRPDRDGNRTDRGNRRASCPDDT